MPPRIQNQLVSNTLLPYISSTPATSSSSLSKLPSQCSSLSRPFSSTVSTKTRQRAQMFEWLNTEGAVLKNHTPGEPNYVGSLRDRRNGGGEDVPNSIMRRPFPLNQNFTSENILSEELRNEIYERVQVFKQSVRAVSVEFGVDMRRVAAVVRLVELEKRQREQGKPLALPYARAVHEMIPTTPLVSQSRKHYHESINDLPVHRLTDPQIFYPVSESRQFNRVDAGRVFSAAPALEHSEAESTKADPNAAINKISQRPGRIERVGKGDDEQQVLQPADVRIPHPHLVVHERDLQAHPNSRREVWERYRERLEAGEKSEQERKDRAKQIKEAQMSKVQPEGSRFEFRIKDTVVSKETTGPDGRGSKAPGRRYGVPTFDRKKGQVKIPTRVEV